MCTESYSEKRVQAWREPLAKFFLPVRFSHNHAKEAETYLYAREVRGDCHCLTMWWSTSANSKKKKSGVPLPLEKFFPSLTDAQTDLCKVLCSEELQQAHLFHHWGAVGESSPAVKRIFVEQLEALDESLPTGIAGYIENARELLEKSSMGENPLKGWKPSIPTGMSFEIGTEEYKKMEDIGRNELGSVGFVLVAGGLGERLGYNGIKVREYSFDGMSFRSDA